MNKKRSKLLLSLMVMMVTLICMSIVAFADEPSAKPSVVTGVKQTDASQSSVKIEWDAVLVDGDANYSVEISADNVNYVEKNDGTYSPSCYISGVSSAKKYFVRVRAYTKYWDSNSSGYVKVYGDYSKPIVVATSPSQKVVNLKEISATTSSVTLSWSKVAGANGYYIYKEYPSSDIKPVAKTTTNKVTLKNISRNSTDSYYVTPYVQGTTYTAIGNYTSIYSSDIKLKPANIAKSKIKVTSYYSAIEKIQVVVDIQKKTDGVLVKAYKNKDKKAAASEYTTSSYGVFLENIKVNNFYRIDVKGYSVINGKKIYSDKCTSIYIAQQPKVSLKWSGNKIKTSWAKTNGATSYTVYASTKKNSGYKKVATTKKTSYKISKIGKTATKKGKRYYVYVVANKKVGKTTYKGNADYSYYLLR